MSVGHTYFVECVSCLPYFKKKNLCYFKVDLIVITKAMDFLEA